VTSVTPTGKLILVVDDEPSVVRSVTTALAMAGFLVMVAENGPAGLDAFARSPKEIDLVLTDLLMPFMNGLEMAARIKELREDVPILVMTAYSDAVVRTLPNMKFPLIRKPFLPDDLIRAIRANIKPPAANA
jgi:two-component system cell cycle sensor histidine kinase/response regulator CckA